MRAKLSDNGLILTASLVYAIALISLALVHNVGVNLVLLVPAGMAWIAVLSSVNASLQLFLPGWVRARGLEIYQMVLFGCQAFGAVLWGFIAAPAGLVATFLIAAAAMIAGGATVRVWPLIDTSDVDRGIETFWPEPRLVVEPDPESGPVVVSKSYTIASANEQHFFEAMERVRLSRLRTGATQWGLFRDAGIERRFVELYSVDSWDEHLRQHSHRLTGADRQFQEEADALSEPPPQASHYISTDVGE